MPEIQEPLRYVGRPFAEVQAELETAGLPYQTEITRPTRDYFKTDERCLYVVRERKLLDGTLAKMSDSGMSVLKAANVDINAIVTGAGEALIAKMKQD